MTGAASINRVVLAFRTVQIGLLLSLIWKWNFFVSSVKTYSAFPITDDFFPAFFRSNESLVGVFVAVVSATTLNILTGSRRCQVAASVVSLTGLSVLCVHQGSYNDATFTTAWWTAAWSLWYVTRMNGDPADLLLRKASLLGRCIVALVLLGGAAGKWTAEYWSGEVLYNIYFVSRDFWTFNWLREQYDNPQLREIAVWYSRAVVVTETAFGLTSWMMPARWAAIAGIVLLSSIALFANFLLFSVLLSLICLSAVGLFVKPTTPPDHA